MAPVTGLRCLSGDKTPGITLTQFPMAMKPKLPVLAMGVCNSMRMQKQMR
jgi:hypothetical protein